MKKSLGLAACLLSLLATAAYAERVDNFSDVAPTKENPGKAIAMPPVERPAGGGFIPIPNLPYSDSGNTCGAANTINAPCALSAAPDVTYQYQAKVDQCVNVSLCNSTYDTMLHIYDSSMTLIACNDDFCGLQSTIKNVSLLAGITYLFVVDGFNTNCGDYTIEIAECPPPCRSDCPPGAIVEGEPSCGNGYIDITNGGCNSVPPVFTPLECNEMGVTVCGTYGNFVSVDGFNSRDTDWYQIVLDQVKNVNFCVCGQGPTQIAIVNANCDPITIACGSVFGEAGEEVCCNAVLPPGTYWLFVSVDGFTGTNCGTPYVMTLEGLSCPVVGVESASWTKMKNIYR